jgi:hypothetical protein
MIENQLAQIGASLPAVENGKIPGQPETSVENVSMVFTGWGGSSRKPPHTNHAGRYNPPRNDIWDGMVAAVQEDPGVPMISCSIYVKHFEQCLCDLGASVNIMPKVIYEELQYPALSPTTMLVQLAEHIFIRVRDSFILANFVVMDMEGDLGVDLVLGRPFLRSARARIDVERGKIRVLEFFLALFSLLQKYQKYFLSFKILWKIIWTSFRANF